MAWPPGLPLPRGSCQGEGPTQRLGFRVEVMESERLERDTELFSFYPSLVVVDSMAPLACWGTGSRSEEPQMEGRRGSGEARLRS